MPIHQIELRRITIQPLSIWNYLRQKQKPESIRWPERSDTLCWNCCHAFTWTPAFLPVECDLRRDTFIFTGNFCSWNCVHKYAWDLQRQKKAPPGVAYIGLLSYMTCHRGLVCTDTMHDLGLCDCLQNFKPLHLPFPREYLKSFGGPMDIQTYRENLQCILDYNWVEMFFHCCKNIEGIYREARKLPPEKRKAWGFQYLSFQAGPGATTSYVEVLPITNRVLQDQDSNALVSKDIKHNRTVRRTKPKAKKKEDDPIVSPHGALRSRPGRRRGLVTSLPRTEPTPVIDSPAEHPQPNMSHEQLLSVNEEQAYYTKNLRQFGNLMDSMGITIQRPD